MPSAMVGIGGNRVEAAIIEKVPPGRDLVRLHADDANVRPLQLHRQRDARDQPAAAQRHDDLRAGQRASRISSPTPVWLATISQSS